MNRIIGIMKSALERYLKEKIYPVSIIWLRELHNSQQTPNMKAISLQQQGRAKRPNKAQPTTCDEELALWTKGQLEDHDGKSPYEQKLKNLSEQLGFHW